MACAIARARNGNVTLSEIGACEACCSMFCMVTPRLKPTFLFVFLLMPAALQTEDSTPVRGARTILEQGAADGEPDVRREVAVALSLPSRRDPSTNLLKTLAT